MVGKSISFYCTPVGFYFPEVIDLEGGGSVDMGPGPIIPYGNDEQLLRILEIKERNPNPKLPLTIDQALKKAKPIHREVGFRTQESLDKGCASVSALHEHKKFKIYYKPMGAGKDVYREDEVDGEDIKALFDWIKSKLCTLLGED